MVNNITVCIHVRVFPDGLIQYSECTYSPKSDLYTWCFSFTESNLDVSDKPRPATVVRRLQSIIGTLLYGVNMPGLFYCSL